MLKAIIVEDEHHSADTLRLILEEYCSDVQISGIYHTLKEGRKGLLNEKPDLLFLDIMLSDGSGFDLLIDQPDLRYKVIFTTAFDHYALKAIRFSALDYLLKPLSIKEVCEAVTKAREFNRNGDEKERVKMLVKNLGGEKLKHIALPTQTGFNFVEVASIVRIEADGSYSKIFFTKGEPVLISHNLK
ncbi:MAG TPA: response regulator [Bacteroidia bacterium]|nr:response regulator [Bacteroidia bacterium]